MKLPKNIKFPMLEGLYWVTFLVFWGFLVSYLNRLGISSTKIGFLLSLCYIGNMCAQPVLGFISDKKGGSYIKIVIIVGFIIGGISTFCIYLAGDFYPAIVFFCLIYSIFQNALTSIIDSFIIKWAVFDKSINYGIARGTGSFSFAVSALLYGFAIDKYGYNIMFVFSAIFTTITILFVSRIEKPPYISTTKDENIITSINMLIMKNKKYVLFVLAATMLYIGHNSTIMYNPIIVSYFGGSQSDLGKVMFLMAIVEVPAFFLSDKIIRKFNLNTLLFTCMIFFVVKSVGLYFSTSMAQLYLIQIVQFMCFGLFWPLALYYISTIVLEHNGAAARAILSAMCLGFGNIIGSLVGGMIIDGYGIKTVYVFTGIVQIIGIAIFTVNYFATKGKEVLQ